MRSTAASVRMLMLCMFGRGRVSCRLEGMPTGRVIVEERGQSGPCPLAPGSGAQIARDNGGVTGDRLAYIYLQLIIIIISFAIRQFQMNPTKPSFDMTILYSYRDECTLNTNQLQCRFVINIQPKILTAIVTNEQKLFVLHSLPLLYSTSSSLPMRASSLNVTITHPRPQPTAPRATPSSLDAPDDPSTRNPLSIEVVRFKLSRAYFGNQKSVRHC